AAIFTGLANLIRQDNILLLAALGIVVLLGAIPWKSKLIIAGTAIGIHVLILSPLLIKNYQELHTLFPPGPAKTAFLTTYEDFHSYNKEIDWQTLRATFGIRDIIAKRFHTAQENIGQVEYFIDPLFGAVFLIALAEIFLVRKDFSKLRLLLPVFSFALLEYFFYSFIASFSGPGSLIKSLGILMPFVCIVIVDTFAAHIQPRLLLIGVIVALSVYGGYQGFEKNYTSTTYYNSIYEQYKILKSIVIRDAKKNNIDENEIAILARDTWDVYEGTGFKTVMVPNNDIETILFVAQNYNAHYILLPADRPQLEKIYNNKTPDPRFHYVGSVPKSYMKIFRMDFDQK
ncbi:MAG TPA: hypothetical protein VHM28_01790, partial [Anaerolineales bacterium]|nr:hypothetical protein [Anaerolineales bacterium]